MNPAKSIILFTTLSGLGNGLLFFLCLGIPAVEGWVAFVFFAIGAALAGGGLLFSFFHLGHPERALKAFAQWRSSWLSREGWLANAALVLAGLYGVSLIFFDTRIAPLGWLAAVFCIATVYATSMIYGQLKTVPRWNHWSTNALFLGLAFAGGALMSGTAWLAIAALAVVGAFQIFAWINGDGAFSGSGSNAGTATGLGDKGTVRAFESPHTGGNYLTHEMVFQVARKHSIKLRVISAVLAFVLPIIFLLIPFSHTFAALAILSHVAGVLVGRWLFLAEAEHVVGIYYGRA